MFDKIKSAIKAAGAVKKAVDIAQAKAKALTADVDLDGTAELDELKQKLPLIKEKALALYQEVLETAQIVWTLVKHVAEAE